MFQNKNDSPKTILLYRLFLTEIFVPLQLKNQKKSLF